MDAASGATRATGGGRASAKVLLLGCVLLSSAGTGAADMHARLRDGVALKLGERRLEVRVCRDDVFRVVDARPGPFFTRQSLVSVAGACVPTPFEVKTGPDAVDVVTKRLAARIALPGSAVTFLDAAGRVLLAEKQGSGRALVPARVMGEDTFHAQAEFERSPGEALYGLGAHQNGLMNYTGRDVDLYQHNIVDVVPFLVSSRGYGLLWDNTSHTKFGDLREPVHVPAANLYDAEGRPGGLTGTYRQGDCETGSVVATRVDPQIAFGAPEDRPAVSALHNTPQVANPQLHPQLAAGEACVVWEGQIAFEAAGEYDLMTFANNGFRLWLDGQLLTDTWRQGWLPWWDALRLVIGSAKERHTLRLEWHRDEGEGTPGALKAAMHPTALGSGARMANAYVLSSSQAVYEGQRAADPHKRVFILTRSAFAGSQRYAAASWSGDVASDWDSLRKQVPAGLNMALSGIPWWTTDVGGFAVPSKWSGRSPRPEDVEEWRELVTRWFQYATFCPLLRVHGQFPYREMWFFGADENHRAYQTQLAFDRLRYRMLPYSYSLAAGVTRLGATPMRPLVMDFREDDAALGVGDQFLFGPSLLVSPVTAKSVTRREVYLPSREDDDSGATRAGWYDFWTGSYLAGGQRIDAPAPYESLPIHVKAGSILAMGPELQHTGEKPADPLTLWVYTGADASFELYEDDGVSYGYEQGLFSTIPLRWDEATSTLTIGARCGSHPGMLVRREIRVVFVTRDRAVPHSPAPAVARSLAYDGSQVVIPGPR